MAHTVENITSNSSSLLVGEQMLQCHRNGEQTLESPGELGTYRKKSNMIKYRLKAHWLYKK